MQCAESLYPGRAAPAPPPAQGRLRSLPTTAQGHRPASREPGLPSSACARHATADRVTPSDLGMMGLDQSLPSGFTGCATGIEATSPRCSSLDENMLCVHCHCVPF